MFQQKQIPQFYFDELNKKENFVEIIGFFLAFLDQLTNIIVIFSNQFVNKDLYWIAIGFWIFNIFIVSFSCLNRIKMAKYWKPALQIQSLNGSSYKFAMIAEWIIKFLLQIFQFIIFVIDGLIANIFTTILVWFGFTKLYCSSIRIYDFMCLILLDGKDLKNESEIMLQKTLSKIYPEKEFSSKVEVFQTQKSLNHKEENEKIQLQQNPNSLKNIVELELIQLANKKIELHLQQTVRNSIDYQENQCLNNRPDTQDVIEKKEIIKKDDCKQFKEEKVQENSVNNEQNNNQTQRIYERDVISLNLLTEFQFKIELAQKIFENTPQLIIQLINQSIGIVQNQGINILSIILAFLNISFFIYSVVKIKKIPMKQICSQVFEFIKYFIISLPYLWICEFIQITVYVLVVYSYEWKDYLIYQDTSYGKDTDDSIRAFIIMYPITFLFTHLLYFSNSDKKKYSFIPCAVKNAFLIQFFIDAQAFKPEHLKYGQQILGKTSFTIFTVLSFLSIVDRFIILIKKKYYKDDNDDIGPIAVEFAVIFFQLIIQYIIKSFSQFINYATYYNWKGYEDKSGNCYEYLERTLQGFLIVYLFRIFIHPFAIVMKLPKSLFFTILQLIVITVDSMLLHFQNNHSYCDDLQFVKRHNYTLILDIIFGVIGVIVSFINGRD